MVLQGYYSVTVRMFESEVGNTFLMTSELLRRALLSLMETSAMTKPVSSFIRYRVQKSVTRWVAK